jgi:hypothetical protein
MNKGTKVIVTGKKVNNALVARSGIFLKETAKTYLIKDSYRDDKYRSYRKDSVILIPQY